MTEHERWAGLDDPDDDTAGSAERGGGSGRPARRDVLRTLGMVSAVGLAGCSTGYDESGTGGTETGTPTSSVQVDVTPTDTATAGTETTPGTAVTGDPSAASTALGPLHERAVVDLVETGDGYAFSPAIVRVREGGSVTWRHEAGAHTATAYHPDNDRPGRSPDGTRAWDSGMLSESGATYSHTFESEGVHDYFCLPHEAMGMVGTVVVGRPDPSGEPGLEPVQSGLPSATQAALTDLNETVTETLEQEGQVTANPTETPAGTPTGTDTPTESETPTPEQTPGTETPSETAPTDQGATAQPETVEIRAVETADGYAFSPTSVTVTRGDTIRWVVESGTHTVTAYHPNNDRTQRIPDGAASWDSGILAPGDTFENKVGVAGTYDYFCLPHESMGMTGQIIVEAAGDGQSSPTQTETPSPTETQTPEQTPTETPTQSTGGSEIAVDIVEGPDSYQFDPELVAVEPGDTVVWTVRAGSHTVTSYHTDAGVPTRIPQGAAPSTSGFVSEGQTFRHTFDAVGVHDYFCRPHHGKGMVGSVVVGNPDPAGQPGLAAPQSSLDEEAQTALSSLNRRATDLLASSGDSGSDGTTTSTPTPTPTAGCDGEPVVSAAETMDQSIAITASAADGTMNPGEEATLIARYDGARLADAPVEIESDDVGRTDSCGTLTFIVPMEEEFRIEIRVGDARGRTEVLTEGNE